MIVERAGLRLTVLQQFSRREEFRGRQLAVEISGAPRGFETRACEIVSHLPALLATRGVDVRVFTPRGMELNVASLVGMQVEDIDAMAARVDTLSQAAMARSVDIAAQIGVRMIRLQAGDFIYQGQRTSFNGCGLAETEFTNGQFRGLLALRREELSKIVANPDELLAKSLGVAAVAAKAEDCPLVYTTQLQREGIARLVGKRLSTEVEYERAASHIDGRAYPFVDGVAVRGFNKNRVTFNDSGTRSVYAHRNGASPEGFLDLAGNVWQWTSSNYDSSGRTKVLRGGCWCNDNGNGLRADSRNYVLPGSSLNVVGFRLAED